MRIYDYEAAFGAADKTSRAMKTAIGDWFTLYYQQQADADRDPSQRIACAVVSRLVRAMFCEYTATADHRNWQRLVDTLGLRKEQAAQLAMVGGECYLKPWIGPEGFDVTLIPRDHILIFARDPEGMPTDVGTVEKSTWGNHYYTLLERRTVDSGGILTVENRLFRASEPDSLGIQVPLWEHPGYAGLEEGFSYPTPVGSVGLVRMKMPILNCVDGSREGVSVYAPATELIRAIDENEAQLRGEFRRGESRVILSRDMLRDGQLQDHLFVGLDEDPEQVGITVFSPPLRVEAYLARKQEYLRNTESILGLRRGMLSDANMDERTATEITSSAGDFSLTVMELQRMWEQTLRDTLVLCAKLSGLYQQALPEDCGVSVDWGNGILYDEDKTWENYLKMVDMGLLAPEAALGWRFGMPFATDAERRQIRDRWMPRG